MVSVLYIAFFVLYFKFRSAEHKIYDITDSYGLSILKKTTFASEANLQPINILLPWEQFAHIGSASPKKRVSSVLGELRLRSGKRLDIEMLDLS